MVLLPNRVQITQAWRLRRRAHVTDKTDLAKSVTCSVASAETMLAYFADIAGSARLPDSEPVIDPCKMHQAVVGPMHIRLFLCAFR